MKRITPRTCLWPLTGCLCGSFALSIGLTYRSDHYCYAATCGEWLFPLQARLHVIVWYMWLSLSVTFLALRAFQPSIKRIVSGSSGISIPLIGQQVRISGILLFCWVCSLYGIVTGIWWIRLKDYFQERGEGLPGNVLVAAVALTGHFADITMGMVLLPVSRHSALASFFRLSPMTTFTFHMIQAYVLFGLVVVHGLIYATWAAYYNQGRDRFRHAFPVLNPTYLYNEVWPGFTSSLGIWRASLIFSGIAASSIMLAMLLTSFPIVRRKHFNLFYFTHLLGIAAVIIICLHASTMLYCTLPGLSMWLLDWSMRVFELKEKVDGHLKVLGNGWYSLTLPLPRKRLSGCACHSPLAHFYIHHSESSIREIHPFTTITHLASSKTLARQEDECISVQFLFRQSVLSDAPRSSSQLVAKKNSQWTNRLASKADEEMVQAHCSASTREVELGADDGAKIALRLEGPYFTHVSPEAYKTVVCLVAGTGLSGAIAIAAAFHATKAAQLPGTESTHPAVNIVKSNSRWDRCVVLWVVRERDAVDIPFFDALSCDGLQFRVHKTGGANPRPDMNKTLMAICGDHGGNSWCYISGPTGFIAAAENACSRIKDLTWFAARWD